MPSRTVAVASRSGLHARPASIFTQAFGPNEVVGATLGYIILTGIKRGMFSNEAGLGSAPNAGASRAAGRLKRMSSPSIAPSKVRETIPLANRKIGSVSSHDVSLPLSALPEFIVRGTEAIAALGDFRINCFGHVGDGNLHFNVFPPKGTRADVWRDRRAAVKAAVHDLVDELGGSVSAEHGVGRLKVADLERYGDPGRLAAMRAVKAALDPLGIMNPGAVLG